MGWMQEGIEVDQQRGICDGTVHDLPTQDFDEYQKSCATRRLNKLGTGHIAVLANGNVPVATSHIPLFRVTSSKYFHSAQYFYSNWDESERRIKQAHRYSPPGTLGFYFGLTLDAAFDEAMYYGHGAIAATNMILVVDCYLDNLLYLAHPLVLADIWKKAKLGEASIFDAYLKIMSGDTGNEVCDRLGRWARQEGYNGVIYPSARYGQQGVLQTALAEGRPVFPVVNFVHMDTKICGYAVEPAIWYHGELIHYLSRVENPERSVPIYAEPNVVLFDNSQLTGFDRPVFYWTMRLSQKDLVAKADRRASSKMYTQFGLNEDGAARIFYNSPYNHSQYEAPSPLVARLARGD